MITNNLLQHFKGYELLIKQLDEAVRRYNRSYVNIAMEFYGMDEIEVIKSFLADSVPYCLIGGYQESFKKRLIIGEYIEENDYVSCLKAKFNKKFVNITHRDVMGATYNLGFDNSKFGDLWVNDDGEIYIYVVSELADYLINNFHQIAHTTVNFELSQYQQQNFKYAESRIIVNSLRLDKIIGSIIHKSREKAKEHIVSGMVNVNYKTIEDCSFVCHNYDILSIRMFGRYKIDNIDINKKSGNYIIQVKKFI